MSQMSGLKGIGVLAVTVTLMVLAGCDQGPEVSVLTVRQGAAQAWFEEPARTRFVGLQTHYMPVAGIAERIAFEPGDPVRQGEILVRIEDNDARMAVAEADAEVGVLRERMAVAAFDAIERSAREEFTAAVDATRSALRASAAQVEAQRKRSARAARDLSRMQKLARQRAISEQDMDDSRLAAETAEIELREREFIYAAFNTLMTAVRLGPRYVDEWLIRKRMQDKVLREQLRAAKARLRRAEYHLGLMQIRAREDGVVVRRFERGGGYFNAGTPLLSVAQPHRLEAISEVLSGDALKLRTGMPVELTAAPGAPLIDGAVKRIEPMGFTKRSSLGVEQQRVRVIIKLNDPPAQLGAGYRLRARFITAAEEQAVTVPRFSVLRDANGEYYVFKLLNGRVQRQRIEIGIENDARFVVSRGISDGDVIVATPDADMHDGDAVRAHE